MHTEELKPIDANNPGYDTGEPNAIGLIAFVITFVVLLVVIIGATAGYFDWAWNRQEESVIQERPSEDLAALRAREDAQLKSYGYINRDKGQLQIPIDRAMELVAQEAAAGKPKYSIAPSPIPKEEPPAAVPAASKK